MTRALFYLVLGLFCALGCQRPEPCADSGRPVDAVLLAFLSRARSAHHIADQAEAAGELRRAVQALAAVVEPTALPASGKDAPEISEVLADTLARLADLESQAGELDAASAHVTRGLSLVPTPTYFRGHLYEVLGLVEERRAARLTAAGDEAGASAARAAALSALETAMKIQADVIQNAAPTPSH